jgi:hypothetical protein
MVFKNKNTVKILKRRILLSLFICVFLVGISTVDAKTYANYKVGDTIRVHVNDTEVREFYVVKNSTTTEDLVSAIAKEDSYPEKYTFENAVQKVEEYQNSWKNINRVELPKFMDLLGFDPNTVCTEGTFTEAKFLYTTKTTYWMADEEKDCDNMESEEDEGKAHWAIGSDLYRTEGIYSTYQDKVDLAIRPAIQVSKTYIEGGVIEEGKEDTGQIPESKPEQKPNTGNKQKVYTNGTVIYYNPETNSICNSKDAVSTTGTKTGCMRWYTFGDAGENASSISLLLDHNTTLKADWNSSGEKEMREAKVVLQEDTKTWKKTARLITADEVASIVGADREDTLKWSSKKGLIPYETFYQSQDYTLDKNISTFYLDGASNIDKTSYRETDGWNKQVASSSRKSKYAWLYDNLLSCKDYGCNMDQYVINIGLPAAYYTSTTAEALNKTGLVFTVTNHGKLDVDLTMKSEFTGIRPVVTVEKSILQKNTTSSITKKCPNDFNIDISACIIGGKSEEECIRINCLGTEQINNPKTGLSILWVLVLGFVSFGGLSILLIRKNYLSKI